MVRIVHCADVHLDSPFTVSDPRTAEIRRMELRSTFTSLIMYAKNYNAKLFLISGDFFDDIHISKDTADMLLREFSSFPDCKFIISPGNHDPYHTKSPYKMLKWPENVHIFKSNDMTRIEVPDLNVDVYGYAFTGNALQVNPFSNKKPQNPSKINILVGHGDTTSVDSLYCPVTKSDIEKSGFDYIALGHIHEATGVIKVGETFISYPGCLEGRGFDELGYKGAMCGEIDKGVCELKGIRFSKKRYEIIQADISTCITEDQVIDELKTLITNYRDDTALRIELIGTLRPDLIIYPSSIESRLKNSLYFLQIKNKTKPYINYNSLKTDKTVKGIMYRKLEEKINSSDSKESENAKLALKYALDAFSNVNILDI